MKNKENKNQETSKHNPKDYFEEVVNSVHKTATSKGWDVEIKSIDDETWKYATIYVARHVGSGLTEGNFDITVENGVRVSKNLLTPFNPHGLSDLHEAIMSELGKLSWLSPPKARPKEVPALDKVVLILNRFHRIARQLHHRYEDREALFINDEYDVQDLLHALLLMFFDDIRPEEYSPSYAGRSSRVDFLLKNEKI